MPEAWRSTVTAAEEVAPGVIQLTVAVEDERFSFVAGQSVTLRLGELRRTYSIASAPQRPLALQLCVRLGPGEGSAAVRRLRAGDALELEGPAGEFIVPQSGNHLVLVAGDTGIAPVRSIVLHLGATADRRPVTVLYEPEGEELYAADFAGLAAGRKIVYATGSVEELIAGHQNSLLKATIMAAGFQPFLMRVEAALAAAKAGGEVRFETYGRLS